MKKIFLFNLMLSLIESSVRSTIKLFDGLDDAFPGLMNRNSKVSDPGPLGPLAIILTYTYHSPLILIELEMTDRSVKQ